MASPPGPRHSHGHGWTRETALSILEDPDRYRTQSPEVLWARVPLVEGEVVADVGAGTGFYAIPAAHHVGPRGRVYAVDLSEDLVDLVGERARSGRLAQLVPVRSTPSRIPLPSGVADVVLLANVLHDIPPSTLAEAVRLLSPGGRLVNVDWKKEPMPVGPPLSIRLTAAAAERTLEGRGLRAIDRWEFGPSHYGLIFRRAARPRRQPRSSRARPGPRREPRRAPSV